MNCWRIQALLAPFIDGELPEIERAAFGDHLNSCEDCERLVSDVAALPSFEGFALPEDECQRVLEALSDSVQERIAASAPTIDEFGQDLASTKSESQGGLLRFLFRGDMHISGVAAAAYVGVVLLLAGGIALNHQRVVDLEASVVERDAIIDGMSSRIAAGTPSNIELLTPGSPSDMGVVIMPAGATGAIGFGPETRLPPSSTWTDPEVVPYTVSYGLPNAGPRVVH